MPIAKLPGNLLQPDLGPSRPRGARTGHRHSGTVVQQSDTYVPRLDQLLLAARRVTVRKVEPSSGRDVEQARSREQERHAKPMHGLAPLVGCRSPQYFETRKLPVGEFLLARADKQLSK